MIPKHDYAMKCIQYDLPTIINNVPYEIVANVCPHSLHGFAGYMKLRTLESYNDNCSILNCYISSKH